MFLYHENIHEKEPVYGIGRHWIIRSYDIRKHSGQYQHRYILHLHWKQVMMMKISRTNPQMTNQQTSLNLNQRLRLSQRLNLQTKQILNLWMKMEV
jgi:hypothetical protein